MAAQPLTQIPAQNAGENLNKNEFFDEKELKKIYNKLGYLQVKVLKLIAASGGKIFMHHDTDSDEPAISDIVKGCCSHKRKAWNTKRVSLSLQKWGLVEIAEEECPNHKGRIKEFVYLTPKGYKLLEIINQNE